MCSIREHSKPHMSTYGMLCNNNTYTGYIYYRCILSQRIVNGSKLQNDSYTLTHGARMSNLGIEKYGRKQKLLMKALTVIHNTDEFFISLFLHFKKFVRISSVNTCNLIKGILTKRYHLLNNPVSSALEALPDPVHSSCYSDHFSLSSMSYEFMQFLQYLPHLV